MLLFENLEGNPDREFLEIVDTVAARAMDEMDCCDLFLVQIDNWFDHKWLGFSGMGRVPSPFPFLSMVPAGAGQKDRFYSVPASFWKKAISVPPFTPNRILSRMHFQRSHSGDFIRCEDPLPQRQGESMRGTVNSARRIQEISDSGVFLWYSSNASQNGAASILIYISKANGVWPIFVSFRFKAGWRVHLTKGIRREYFESLLSDRKLTTS
jgi:hypothetical protein